jgi:uncharacterized membrane protein
MDETNTSGAIFHARLTPHRSLGPKGFRILMGVFIAIWLVTGAVFLSLGAWPIFGFFGLDVLLIWLAFRWNYHSGRAHEEVVLSPLHLSIHKHAPSGKKSEHGFNPFWAKFDVKRHELAGITLMRVAGEGRAVTLGGFLNPDDRESFSRAFSSALSEAKRR